MNQKYLSVITRRRFFHENLHSMETSVGSVEVKTWQEMLKKTVELLFTMDSEKFLAFEHARGMNGKKNKYISVKSEGMRKPQLILDQVYIETNMSLRREREREALKNLEQASITSTDFWANPIDDEVWNDVKTRGYSAHPISIQ